MTNAGIYDVAIAGGGLAGLAAAILLGKKGYRVILFEKEKYPFHKVCGEYISLESRDFLCSLGLPLQGWDIPLVNTLSVSSPDGTLLNQALPLGGFGISRYKIDHALVNIAREARVEVHEGTRVLEIFFKNESFSIVTDNGNYHAAVCCGAFGKRSNLDVKWKRPFIQKKANALNNFIAVKYHAHLDHPRNNIALHNFLDGYCGIAPIEDGKTCICYLTTAQNLRSNSNNIQQMEEKVLFRNPFLRNIFRNALMDFTKPLAISQISFDKKEQVRDHVLFLGDSAGLIAPLCGNGMSMALHSGRIVVPLISQYMDKRIGREEIESIYEREWNRMFGRRLRAGRMIQAMFGREWLTNTMVSVLRHFPGIVTRIIRQTHG